MLRKRTALIFALALVSVMVAVPLFSDTAQGTPALDVEISFSPGSYGELNLQPGESAKVIITMRNNSADLRNVEFIGVDFEGKPLNATINWDSPLAELDGISELSSHRTLTVTVNAERYMGSSSNITATFRFIVSDPSVTYDPSDPSTGKECTLTKTVNVKSMRASENQYNKIMGIIINPLPAPFDTAVYATAVTFVIWLVIAVFAAFLIIPKVFMPIIFKKKEKENRKIFYKKIQLPLFVMVLLYGLTVCLSVLGVGEFIISTATMLVNIVYICLGAWIAIKVLAAVLDMWEKRAKEEDEEEYDVRDSLSPLFMMLGKIIVGMATVAAILGVLGFDLMIIATGAGIIGLAISFGAQSTLAQFFGGITLLVNRPFRPGDLIRLDNGTDTLRVLNVGFMMTTFRNWANSEIFSMPNQKVVSSTIINVTAESLAFRIVVLVRVPYGTDVALAKRLALQAMTEHPRILQDGSEEIPKVRLEEFSESALTIRVSGFVDDFEDHRSIAGEIREAIYTKYRENGIAIAIPKMDVYIKDPKGGEEKI